MNSELKKALKRFSKACGPRRGFPMARMIPDENAALRAQLDRAQIGGRVGVIVAGMDCDCSKYSRRYHRPAFRSVAEFRKFLEREYDEAEGPHEVRLAAPDSIIPGSESRDLALEAFEEGHPHIVYY